VEEFETDLAFVSSLVRSNKDKISEKPLVRVDLQSPVSSKHKHTVVIQANNKLLELELSNVDGLASSIYHGQRFWIRIPSTMFIIEETGLLWIQLYYQWLLGANCCEILIVHDQWQANQIAAGAVAAGMFCALIPNEKLLTSPGHAELVLSPELVKALAMANATHLEPLDITDEIANYSAWVVDKNARTGKPYAVILDITKTYSVRGDDDDNAMSDGASPKPKPLVETSWCPLHTSIVCRMYPDMHKKQHLFHCLHRCL